MEVNADTLHTIAEELKTQAAALEQRAQAIELLAERCAALITVAPAPQPTPTPQPAPSTPETRSYRLSPAADKAKYNPRGFAGQAEEGSYMILPQALDGAVHAVRVVRGNGQEIAGTKLRGQRDEGRPLYKAEKRLGLVAGPIYFEVLLLRGDVLHYRVGDPSREAKNHNQGGAQPLYVSQG